MLIAKRIFLPRLGLEFGNVVPLLSVGFDFLYWANGTFGVLPYPSLSCSPLKAPSIQQPSQLLTFSYDSNHVQEFNDSALRYYVEPPRGADLGFHYEKSIIRPAERGRLDALLAALSRFKNTLCASSSSRSTVNIPDVNVICWRGVMTKILAAPYEETDSLELNVMLINGTFYFEEHSSDAKLEEKNATTPRNRLLSYYGYAFESYCTTSQPGGHHDVPPDSQDFPGWGGDVNTNIQWCSVVKTKLADRRVIMGGEVDCVRGTYYGKTDNYVELKTSLSLRNSSDEARFEKKLLKFYLQSFLLGVPEIVVGFRTPSGRLTALQSFRTMEIPRLVRGKPGAWDPSICLEWGDRFLAFLQSTIQSSSGREVWRVSFKPRVGITVVMLNEAEVAEVVNGEERVGFFPRWYWEESMALGTCNDTIRLNSELSTLGHLHLIWRALVRKLHRARIKASLATPVKAPASYLYTSCK
ncbi:RAI1 like PD-XK nuclease-domain-containing protein [Pisolithus croceorrhizus]|nr:RAI1 like PD-XK nuclease-domain-containing protein [Pisolithus croceorrhizus]